LKKKIPLHSLVLCESLDRLDDFPLHERVSRSTIEQDLVGGVHRTELSDIVFDELRHRAGLKLSLGERVALYIGDLTIDEKYQMSSLATNQGASVIDIVSTETSIVPVKPHYDGTLKSNWMGITVVGDLHGDCAALMEALRWARSRQNFTWLLGDIIDYGSQTLETMTAVYESVMRGEAGMILGNHEKKIARWLDQKDKGKVYLRMSDGNKVTTRALDKLTPVARRRWIGQFRSLLAHSSLVYQFDQTVLVHAAAHASLWTNQIDNYAVEQFALYGESDNAGGKFRRTYNWVDQVPKGQMVFVGHDVLHSYPWVRTGTKGGQVVFLDTGCGKGGYLSSADLRFDGPTLRLECFKRY
jgi:hypothetical protein